MRSVDLKQIVCSNGRKEVVRSVDFLKAICVHESGRATITGNQKLSFRIETWDFTVSVSDSAKALQFCILDSFGSVFLRCDFAEIGSPGTSGKHRKRNIKIQKMHGGNKL